MKKNIEILGKKIGMTQIYTEDNRLIPVTVVEAGPCPVTQIKADKEGYKAVQIGFRAQKEHRLSDAALGHTKKAGVQPVAQLAEFRTENIDDYKPGDVITVSNFTVGQLVDVISVTRGMGFQGVVKRWDFGGGPASHGHMSHRRGGSYGQRQWPGEVDKNKKMPGHMGVDRKTIQNLEIVKIIPEKNIILIKGSLGGSKGALVTIRKAKKSAA